jgi:hypothetical protein
MDVGSCRRESVRCARDFDVTLSIEVIGPFKGPTGHDRHTREFVRHLVRLGARVQLTPLNGWSPDLPHGVRDTWFDGLARPIETSVALHFTMPTLCRPRAGKRNINYTMFEADRIPREWVARAAVHDRILVPTEPCRRAWIDSGVSAEKMRVSPLAVDVDFFAEKAPPLPLRLPNGRDVASYANRFLNIADLRPRKNHLGLLRTWARATKATDDAVLILKFTAPHPNSMALLSADIAAIPLHNAAPVVVMTNILSDHELRSLYYTATHYISMSCGEGWDFPMMESAVAGLRLIAPRHSAYCTYLTDDDAEMIPAPLTPAIVEGRAGAEDRIWFDGSNWWRPDEEAAAAIIARIINGGDSKKPPSERIRREHRWENAGAILYGHLTSF